MASLASSEGGQDPVDAAIRVSASHKLAPGLAKVIAFVPFDPAKKTSEATATNPNGGALHIIKGAYTAGAALAAGIACRGRDR